MFRPLLPFAAALFGVAASAAETAAPIPLQGVAQWSSYRQERVVLSDEHGVRLAAGAESGQLVSPVLDWGEGRSTRFVGWVDGQTPGATVAVALRDAPAAFAADAPEPAWRAVRCGEILPAGGGRHVQYRIALATRAPERRPYVRELLLSHETPAERYRAVGLAPKPLADLSPMMLYSVTGEKLKQVYDRLPYDASERGLYIFRNAPDRPIGDDYRFVPDRHEMYLPMRYGVRILARIHPVATFDARTLKPADAILRAKDGTEKKPSAAGQHRAVNFFDSAFLREYHAGLRAAVRYYRDHNPYVFGYTFMAPEFFYDTEPWPQMTYLGGFGPEALAAYRAYADALGRRADAWPAVSDGDVLLDADGYLWAYWRSRAGADYMAALARIVKEEHPAALAGTMHYVGAQSLRGMEPAFVEANPDYDFYYSSNIFPRVPGPDGLDGGTTFSYTRLNTLGAPRKANLLEYDLWSPYVDERRALTYARYAALENVQPIPIVLGDFPGKAPSNHLTRYHGMKGTALTPELLDRLAARIRETRPLRTSRKYADVAVVLPSISLFAVLEKDRWLPHRLVQQQLHILGTLTRLNAAVDFLTEGHTSPEILDRYKLVIVQQPAVYPWMRAALSQTRATVLALGWAGTVAAPGPKALDAALAPESFDFALTHAWPRGGDAGTTIFATGGKVVEGATRFRFADREHPLLKGLAGLEVEYRGRGLRSGPPYAAGFGGEPLAVDADGRTVFAELNEDGRRTIHFGGLPWGLADDGGEKALFTPEQEDRLFANLLDRVGAEYYPDSGPLRLMRNNEWLVVENSSPDQAYAGPLPKPAGGGKPLPAVMVELAPLDSLALPLR